MRSTRKDHSFRLLSISSLSRFGAVTFSFVLLSGCATAEKKSPEVEELKKQVQEMKQVISANQSKMESIEKKIVQVEDQLKESQESQGALEPKTPSAPIVPSISHPAEAAGEPVKAKQAKKDPEIGFVQDEPVQTFRKALSLKKGGKVSEGLIAFSQFVERFPDHPLASHAQFQVGDAYFQQKEYSLAVKELEKLIKVYDKSSRIPEALSVLISSHEALNQKEQAAQARQLLTSLYPQSPAAKSVLSAPATPSPVAPVPTAGSIHP
jgi:TolA-binding protein